jgi:LmbE family N-acetylglucosaminyl deacetylase
MMHLSVVQMLIMISHHAKQKTHLSEAQQRTLCRALQFPAHWVLDQHLSTQYANPPRQTQKLGPVMEKKRFATEYKTWSL